ncbi:MAG: hypothetical protein GWP58_13125 [Gammaproteobacteria bacterium]|jgi:cytochrome b561|nr:hypothetical protein [Gammaproteobacteria bacterium]
MIWRNTSQAWGRIARGLHWLMALLIAAQLILGWIAQQWERSPLKIDMMTAHKSLGITLLMLLVVRLLWRWFDPAPGYPEGSRGWEHILSRFTHATLYLLISGMILSGWLAASTSVVPWKLWWFIPWPRLTGPDKALHELAGESHELLAWLILIVITGHVIAALRHHFIKRNDVLKRMWKGMLLVTPLIMMMTSINAAESNYWGMANASGELQFTARYENEKLEGRFKIISVRLDPGQNGRSFESLVVRVDVGSADMNDAEINDALRDQDWFDTGSYPEAEFKSNHIVRTGQDAFIAHGTLRLKGQEQDLDVPFQWRLKSQQAVMNGYLELSRLDWGVGSGEWADTRTISDSVELQFHLQLEQMD